MKSGLILLRVGWVMAALLLIGCASPETIRIQFIKYPIERTYKAEFDRTWKAAVEAMKDYELVVQDDSSGLLISDWIKGLSDTYRRRGKDGEQEACPCEFTIHAKVEEAGKGKTRVHIDLYEKTLLVYPETGEVWKKTESSTLREKAMLDRIGDILARD